MTLEETLKDINDKLQAINKRLDGIQDNSDAIAQLQEAVDQLNMDFDNLTSDSTIPKDVDSAFRARFIKNLGTVAPNSTTQPTDHNKTVNEGGSASYAVLDKPDAFAQASINGTAVAIPIYLM